MSHLLPPLRPLLAFALIGTTGALSASASPAAKPQDEPAATSAKAGTAPKTGQTKVKTAPAPKDELPLLIQVRSEVDQPFEGWGKAKLKDHGRLYAIVAISELPAEEKLIRPVNENELLRLLRIELTKRGFVEIKPDQQPEIVLTISYGRGFVRNPYQDDVMVNDSSDPPVVTIQGAFPTQLIRQKEKDFEEKLQTANFEKLFIRVTAWKFPEKSNDGKKVKPYQYWKTMIVTDDPMHRDLNQFMEKMVAAGAQFFDRKIEKEEAQIVDTLPEGTVTVGDIKVLEPGEADLPLSKDKKKK